MKKNNVEREKNYLSTVITEVKRQCDLHKGKMVLGIKRRILLNWSQWNMINYTVVWGLIPKDTTEVKVYTRFLDWEVRCIVC